LAVTDNMRGAGLMMASMAAFTLNDVCIKAVAGDLPLMQAIFIRGVITTAMIFVLGRAMGAIRLDLPRRDWNLIGLRTLAEIGATFFFLTALFHMPIANVTAILQALPLTVALAAVLFLGEPVGWRRLTAILVGFCGVLLIVRPGAEGFSVYSVYALAAVGFVTLRDLSARRLSSAVPSVTVALCTATAIMTVSGLATWASGGWTPVGARPAGLLAMAAVFIVGGYLFSVMTMRRGEIGFIAPFRYTGLLWALVLGFVVFGEWPDMLTLAGAGIVVAMGIFTLYREKRARRRNPG
jgi:drug/metabolite transporter (DMT)-like permease